MEQLLYDLHKTDGVISVRELNYNHDEELKRYYQTTLAKHGVTQAQFDSSLVWYTDNPKRFNKIYPAVIKRLQAELDSFAWLDEEERREREKNATDSLVITLYDFDNLIETLVCGCRIYTPQAMQPLEKDTSLYYIFPHETIDSLSLAATADTIPMVASLN